MSGCQGLEVEEDCDYNGIAQRSFGVIKLFCTLIMVAMTLIYICIKIHRAIYQKTSILLD